MGIIELYLCVILCKQMHGSIYQSAWAAVQNTTGWWLKKQAWIFSQFWRLQGQGEVASKLGFL